MADTRFFLGLDLGTMQDHSALALLEAREQPDAGEAEPEPVEERPTLWTSAAGDAARWLFSGGRVSPTRPESRPVAPPGKHYHARWLQRWPLGVRYRQVVEDVAAMLRTPPLSDEPGAVELVVDATGVGEGVLDLFDAARVKYVAVTITGGGKEEGGGVRWRVPKKTLVGAAQLLLQDGRLRIAPGLPDAAQLQKELRDFRFRINAETAHVSFESWREKAGDDLVLAVSLAAWRATRPRREVIFAMADAPARPPGWPWS